MYRCKIDKKSDCYLPQTTLGRLARPHDLQEAALLFDVILPNGVPRLHGQETLAHRTLCALLGPLNPAECLVGNRRTVAVQPGIPAGTELRDRPVKIFAVVVVVRSQ